LPDGFLQKTIGLIFLFSKILLQNNEWNRMSRALCSCWSVCMKELRKNEIGIPLAKELLHE
jgi:hypothetical protein